MNDTKWRELCVAFAQFDPKPSWRTRDLLNGHLSHWDKEWFHHIGPDYCSIHWLEIDPDGCSKERIRQVLESVGVPFDEASCFKVHGYR